MRGDHTHKKKKKGGGGGGLKKKKKVMYTHKKIKNIKEWGAREEGPPKFPTGLEFIAFANKTAGVADSTLASVQNAARLHHQKNDCSRGYKME